MDNCVRSGQQIALLASALAVAISKGLTTTEENVIGNLIVQVGSVLLSIAAADQACESSGTSSAADPAANTAAQANLT